MKKPLNLLYEKMFILINLTTKLLNGMRRSNWIQLEAKKILILKKIIMLYSMELVAQVNQFQ